ncbi:hypothetical protein PWY87_34130 [Kribbella solani]|nr:hypothetical protein [Kribbella solani]MDX3006756.1 hypothetical protein [Kribbella solani]
MSEWVTTAAPELLLYGLAAQFVLLTLTGLACAFTWLAMNTN